MYSKKPNNPGTSSGAGGGQGQRQRTTTTHPRWIFKALYYATLLAASAVAFANMRPYINLVKHLGLQLLDKFLLKFLASIPIINAITDAGIGVVSLICGVALWATFQIIEVLPVVLYNHAGFLEEVISDAESGRKYAIKHDEDPTVRGLKEVYNKLPVAFLENLAKVRAIAYALDFMICEWNYSPVKSGKITDFFYILATGQWHKVDWSNLTLALVTLFGVEVAVMLLLWVSKLAFTVKRAADKQ